MVRSGWYNRGTKFAIIVLIFSNFQIFNNICPFTCQLFMGQKLINSQPVHSSSRSSLYSAGRFVQLWAAILWARAFPARLHLQGGLRLPRRPAPPAVPGGVRAVPCSAAVGRAPLVRLAAARGSAVGDVDRGLESRFKFVHRLYIMIHHHQMALQQTTYVLLAANRDSRGRQPGPVDGFQPISR